MSAMGVLIQAMVWLGLPQPPMWQLIAYMLAIGMFGAGIGMLYTPILIDRMQLVFPSGLAVANILRALTDPVLLRRSVSLLASGVAVGLAGGIGAAKIALLGTIELSSSTFGAGMVVGARIGLATVTGGLVGVILKPYFISIGWLQPGDPARKIMFLIALGWIMGAAIVDMTVIAARAIARWRETAAVPGARAAAPAERQGWSRVHTTRLVIWSICWGAAVVAIGHLVLHQPVLYLTVALALVMVFALVNGISLGISDSNPISSAFVVSIVILAAIGLKDPAVGIMAGTVLLVSTSVACDMQQDRSTGARLGTNRVMQFRYQAAGILVGAVLAVAFARLFMAAYPVLLLDQTKMTEGQAPSQWNAAMTFKFVGILRSLTEDKPYQRTAIWIGVGTGLLIELVRKIVFASRRMAGVQEDAHRPRGRLRARLHRPVVALRAVVRRLLQPADVALARRGRRGRESHRRACRRREGEATAGRRRRAAVGHDRHVALRRRPDRRRCAGRARSRPDRARLARRGVKARGSPGGGRSGPCRGRGQPARTTVRGRREIRSARR